MKVLNALNNEVSKYIKGKYINKNRYFDDNMNKMKLDYMNFMNFDP